MNTDKRPMPQGLANIYKNLDREVSSLHAKWKIFHQLYVTSEERVKFFSEIAPDFFGVIQHVLRDDIFLSISRLTDPLKSAGKENLTLVRLLENLNPIDDPQFYQNIEVSVKKIESYCQPFREWRKRRIAHSDLATVLEYHPDPLPGISGEMIEGALQRISALLNQILGHYESAETIYTEVILRGDANDVVFLLEQAVAHHKQKFEQATKRGWTRPLGIEGSTTTDEYQATLQSWIRESGEALVDIYLHHSGGGGTLYLLKLPDQVEATIERALSEAGRYGDGQATLTGFRSGYYPLRGNVDEPFIEKIQSAWGEERWYSMVSLEDVFPERLHIVGSGDTKQELERDLADLLADWKGHFVGFGENPFDTNDWAERNRVEVVKTTVGKLKYGKPNGT